MATAKGRKVGRWKNSPYGKRYTGTWKTRKQKRIAAHLETYDQHKRDKQSRAAYDRLSASK